MLAALWRWCRRSSGAAPSESEARRTGGPTDGKWTAPGVAALAAASATVLADAEEDPDAPRFVDGSYARSAGARVVARYKWTTRWRYGKLRSADPDGTCTILWEDGFLQVGTRPRDVRRRPENGAGRAEAVAAARAAADAPGDPTVWELAKRGDVAGVVALVDGGDASPNGPEPLRDSAGAVYDGRTPLYWACHGGHAALVRALLVRGGVDDDGTCALAVTSKARADDDRDLLFDPDNNAFSDHVDYVARADEAVAEDTSAEIRSLLAASAAARKRVFYAAARGECCVCAAARADAVAEPCGHVSCCAACLEALRARRDGCPICRQRIRAIARAAPRADPGAPGAPDPVPHAEVLAVAPPRAPALFEAPPAEVLAVAPHRAPALSEAPPAA